MKTQSFFSTPVAEKSQEEAFEEASLRNALERMGASGARARPQQSAPRPTSENMQGKRRRFVKDGDVQVEKHSLARTTPRTLAVPKSFSTSRAVHFSDEENSEATKIRRQLADEKLRAEDAERQFDALQIAHKSLETRQVHADLMVRELKATVLERETALDELNRVLRGLKRDLELKDEEIQELQKKLDAKPRGRPRLRPLEDAASETVQGESARKEDEPQPVKWWKD